MQIKGLDNQFVDQKLILPSIYNKVARITEITKQTRYKILSSNFCRPCDRTKLSTNL